MAEQAYNEWTSHMQGIVPLAKTLLKDRWKTNPSHGDDDTSVIHLCMCE